MFKIFRKGYMIIIIVNFVKIIIYMYVRFDEYNIEIIKGFVVYCSICICIFLC